MNRITFLGSNISLVKAHNLRAILLSLLHEGRVSRVQLAKKTALSTTTITNLIAELIEQGIVVEEGAEQIEGQRKVGRPRTALRLVPDARYAVGIHIGVGLFRVAVTNLHAEILHNEIETFTPETSSDKVLKNISAAVERCITKSLVDRVRIIGVGVGASGLVNYQTGVNVFAPNLGWKDVPLRERMETSLGLPVMVDNNVRAMALAEAFFGIGRGVSSLAFVYGRVGVGAGFVVGDQIFRGSSAGAGEIGHTIMIADDGDLCRCGRRGCLETFVSEPVLVRQAEALAQENPAALLATYLRERGDTNPLEAIFAAARDGDIDARKIIERKARYLGIALANLVDILNPELILLGGMFSQGHDLFLPVAEATMREMAFGGLGEKVNVATTSFGWRAGVIGASALALTTFFYQQTESM